jgi:PAS domain S-box-containing protein
LILNGCILFQTRYKETGSGRSPQGAGKASQQTTAVSGAREQPIDHKKRVQEAMKPYHADDIDFSEWQRIVDILSTLAGVKSAAITRIEQPYIQAFKLSASDDVPFYEGMTIELNNHYCEEVFHSRERLLVTDARQEERWMSTDELKHGLVSYLGYPLLLPDGSVFGTLCIHDDKENSYSPEIDALMAHFKRVIESHFQLAEQTRRARESEARYKSLVENAADAIFVLSDTGSIKDANSEACRRYGFAYDELIQSTINDLAKERDAGRTESWLLECLKKGQAICETEHVASDGTTIPVEMNARLIPRADGGTILALARDISARKEVEQLKADIDRISKHDLKTPLNGLISLPEVLLADDNLSAEQRQLLKDMHATGYRMLDMINLSLGLYQMEQGEYAYEPEIVDLIPLIRDAQNDMGALCRSKQLQVLLHLNGQEIDGTGRFVVLGERVLCYSVVANLLKNAVQASPHGEDVIIDLQDQNPRFARMAISSNSLIPEAIRHRFGEKYVTSGKKRGTGLGVYSARLCVETMNGRLIWTSSEQDGTTILVDLPHPQ